MPIQRPDYFQQAPVGHPQGTFTPVRCISSRATRMKWVCAISSSKTTRTIGREPWSSVGRCEE